MPIGFRGGPKKCSDLTWKAELLTELPERAHKASPAAHNAEPALRTPCPMGCNAGPKVLHSAPEVVTSKSVVGSMEPRSCVPEQAWRTLCAALLHAAPMWYAFGKRLRVPCRVLLAPAPG